MTKKKFTVTRTSMNRGKKPCEEAVKNGRNEFGNLWTVELSFDELIELMEKYDSVIISDGLPYLHLEIYDGCRE